jgi:hypothetical protein
MRFRQRPLCAPRSSSRRLRRPYLERLEARLAMSAATVSPAQFALAQTIVVRPAVMSGTAGSSPAVIKEGIGRAGSAGYGTASPHGYTPQDLRVAYGLTTIEFGSIVGDGAGQTIAIVDAYDDPDLGDSSSPNFGSGDLARFDQAFGLPDPPVFEKFNEYGNPTALPGPDPAGPGNPFGNWELEEALDVEWAHAMAPGANIDLVETSSDLGTDMYTGVTTAAGLAGVSVVSMSWGSSEYSGEQLFDDDFTTPGGHQGVTFVAATGDSGAPGLYPAYSPNVVAAGGTTLSLSASGSYDSETAWSGGGGGVSAYEYEPGFQAGVQNTGMRTVPDISFDANPSTGVAVYDSYNGTSSDPWEQVGGTSVAAPSLSGMFAVANEGRVRGGRTTLDGASQTLTALYRMPSADYNDITTGSNGAFTAGPGYDETTGLGTPRANFFVPDLADYGITDKLVVTAQPPESVTAGNEFGLTVLVEDSSGNVASNYTGSVTVTPAENPEKAAITGTDTVLASAGVATFSDLTLDRAGDGYTLVLDAGGSAFAQTSSIAVAPAAAAQLVVISRPNPHWTVGQPFTLTVAVEDRFGNRETSYSGRVVAWPAGRPPRNTLGGERVVAANQGLAIFSDLSWKKIGLGDAVKVTASSHLKDAMTAVSNVISTASSADGPLARRRHDRLKHAIRPSRG